MKKLDEENWVRLYHAALLDLQYATMLGRIGEARAEMVARVKKLQNTPGLHPDERRVIVDDALNSLRLLEQEEARWQEQSSAARIFSSAA
jgi:hypothetical protein